MQVHEAKLMSLELILRMAGSHQTSDISYVSQVISALEWSKSVPGETDWEAFAIVQERADDGFVQDGGGRMDSNGIEEIN